jgi:hypothetical protein
MGVHLDIYCIRHKMYYIMMIRFPHKFRLSAVRHRLAQSLKAVIFQDGHRKLPT